MAKREILLYHNRLSLSHEILEVQDRYRIRFCDAHTSEDAVGLLERDSYEGVIVSLERPTIDAYTIIDKASFLNIPIMVYSDLGEDAYTQKALRLGATKVFRYPVRLAEMTEEILENRPLEIRLNDRALDEKISNIFLAAGIPPHIKGYQFLREAVKQSIHTPDMINNITKKLYPAVAEQFQTTPSKVERAIRHAIEVAWARGKIENINAIYGVKVFQKGEKPTNGELIALISDKLMIESN